MISENPFAEFRKECETTLAYALKKTLPEIKIDTLSLNKPPNTNFGQLASSLCFELAKKLNQKPIVLAERLVKAMDKSSFILIEKVVSAGGYVNFHADFSKFSALTLASIRELNSEYGFVKVEKPLRLDRARALGYKAKRGFVILRVRLSKRLPRCRRPGTSRNAKKGNRERCVCCYNRWPNLQSRLSC